MTATIKQWLKTSKRTRAWLGDQCGVTKRTVDNWLSGSQPITGANLRLIEMLIARDAAAAAELAADQAERQNIVLRVDLDLFDLARKALEHGLTIKEWAIHELDKAADEA